ncbi:hypothetical protein D3C86_2141040 [compost metagenome]
MVRIGSYADTLARLEQINDDVRAGVGLACTWRPLNKQHAVLEVSHHLLDGIHCRQA